MTNTNLGRELMRIHKLGNITNQVRHEVMKKLPKYCTGRPDLHKDDLDGLLWFSDVWATDFLNISEGEWDFASTGLESYLQGLPSPILGDIWAAFEYTQRVVGYNLAKGYLTLKSDLTLKEVSFSKPVDIDLIKMFTGNRSGRPRMPPITRKRANGLWWLLAVGDIIKDIGAMNCSTEMGYVLEGGIEEDRFMAGEQVVRRLAMYHETKYPTAPRT